MTRLTNLMKKNLLLYSLAQCDVCGELKTKRNNIYKVSLDVNEEIIASL